MKKLNTLIILLALIAWNTTMVAQRYVAEVFTDVKVQETSAMSTL
ncbi:MAG: hypothetical protein KatS3mg029_0523 [Saprospiraceae bacterium]|nr:MAG: hypothetical protein KatS3mg029_0523 [Saprospiraceae bacterium]